LGAGGKGKAEPDHPGHEKGVESAQGHEPYQVPAGEERDAPGDGHRNETDIHATPQNREELERGQVRTNYADQRVEAPEQQKRDGRGQHSRSGQHRDHQLLATQ
jgi:hypothetical protein